MASSNQCGNCGKVGHFRANCPDPKNECTKYWSAAKAQHRREHPEEFQKLQQRKHQNQKWKDEGKTVPFTILNEAVCKMQQTLYDLFHELDILGRPIEWNEVNKKLDALLPLIRELIHNGEGFIDQSLLLQMFDVVDGDILSSRISDIAEQRDKLVHRVKSFVNGKLGTLAKIYSRSTSEDFLRYIYEQHPPLRPFTFDGNTLNGSTLKKHVKIALLHYHLDKQSGFDNDWKCLCEAISRCLTIMKDKL